MTSATRPLPVTEIADTDDEQEIVNLIYSLMKHVQRKNMLRENLHQKQNNFRNILVELEREIMSLKIDNISLRTCNEKQKKMIFSLEERVHKLDEQIDSLLYKLNNANDVLRNMQQEIRDKDKQLKQHVIYKQKIIQKCNNKIQTETDKMTKELETKLHEQREHLQKYIKNKDEKLKLMKQILVNNENIFDDGTVTAQSNLSPNTETPKEPVSTTPMKKFSTVVSVHSEAPSTSTIVSTDITAKSDSETTKSGNDPIEPCKPSRRDKIPVVNPRYRSRNANKWIDHRPAQMVPVGTIFQPQTPSKCSIMKLTDPKPFMTRSIRYCLYAQEQDTDGELETKLYKADVLPTSGGGAQIVFNDIECLKQVSPAKQEKHRPVTAESSSVHSDTSYLVHTAERVPLTPSMKPEKARQN